MTDKEQIIIDGVDVRNCKFFLPSDKYCGGVDSTVVWSLSCEDYPNCYYKQLSGKAQECEELKAEKEVIKKYLGISDKSIMQRLEELTEYKLKRQLKYIKIEEERDRYLKALEEIEGFRKKHCDFWCEGNRILDIINKAKGEGKCQ